MLIWQVCIILAVQSLSSGRAAILGYTMPIFSAVIGSLLFSAALSRRAWLGVIAAAVGVGLLLWHELTGLAAGPPASHWPFSPQPPGRWAPDVEAHPHPGADADALLLDDGSDGVVITVLALVVDCGARQMPSTAVSWAIAYNAVMVFAMPTLRGSSWRAACPRWRRR